MQFRRERVRIETQRHELVGTLQLPSEGYRSRTTDFLNAHESEFLALRDVDLTWIDASRPSERHEFLAVAARHVVVVVELEDLGAIDDGAQPAAAPLLAVSAPPPAD
jgi:hypothetical protein